MFYGDITQNVTKVIMNKYSTNKHSLVFYTDNALDMASFFDHLLPN